MKPTFFQAAIIAVLIGALPRAPQAAGVHLVSSQPITATDTPNNPPVHYVPKMAAKLGLPQPQKRDVPEISHSDEAMALAVRQLLESHRRQTVYLERLAALAPKSRIDEPHSSPKKSSPKQPTKPSPSPTKPVPESPAVMRLANQRPLSVPPKESVHSPEKKITPAEKIVKTAAPVNESSDKGSGSSGNQVPVRTSVVNQNPVIHSPNLLPPPFPVHHFFHFLAPNSPKALQRSRIGPFPPIPEDIRRGYSPNLKHPVNDGYFSSVLPRAYPSTQTGYLSDYPRFETVPINVLPSLFRSDRRSRFPPPSSSASNYHFVT